jgi:hypothetical protein
VSSWPVTATSADPESTEVIPPHELPEPPEQPDEPGQPDVGPWKDPEAPPWERPGVPPAPAPREPNDPERDIIPPKLEKRRCRG